MTDQKRTGVDFAVEMRETYLGAVPHTIFTAMVWLGSAWWASYFSKPQAIVVFILGGTFTFPGGELIRKFMRVPNTLSPENKLPQLFMLLAFTIPLSYPLIYLICKANINLFFSSFSILVGAHYLPFIFGYKMKTFGVLSIVLVLLGTWFSVYFPHEFALPGYATSGVLLTFALVHFVLLKNHSVG